MRTGNDLLVSRFNLVGLVKLFLKSHFVGLLVFVRGNVFYLVRFEIDQSMKYM